MGDSGDGGDASGTGTRENIVDACGSKMSCEAGCVSKWKAHIAQKRREIREFGRRVLEEFRAKKQKRTSSPRLEEVRRVEEQQFANAIVRSAREAYVKLLRVEGKPILRVTREAMKRDAEAKRREDAAAAQAGEDEADDDASNGDDSDFEPDDNDDGDDDDDEAVSLEEEDAHVLDEDTAMPSAEGNSDSGDDSGGTSLALHDESPEIDEAAPGEDKIETKLLGGIYDRGSYGEFLADFPRRWPSWDNFQDAFQTFCTDTFQRFPVRSSTKVSHRNEQIKKSITNVTGVIPLSWVHYCKTYVCTHGEKYVPRGKGMRKHVLTRKTECSAKVNCTVSWGSNEVGWYLHVLPKGVHNHATTKQLWIYYAENRKIRDPAIMGRVQEMHASGSKPSKLRDVHNLIQALKREGRNGRSSAERTESLLREFCTEDEGNSAEIVVDGATNVAQVVTFQSARMKRLFRTFPEVIMVDTTHGTNINRYKLFSFVVHDIFGKGKYVQHALVVNETKTNLRCAVDVFKMNNPTWSDINVIVSDKAFHEKAVLQAAFPQARQLLCHFHVVEWLHMQVSRLATVTTAEKDILKGAMSALMAARNEDDYQEQKEGLLDRLGGDITHPLYVFFLNNWDNCKEEWVLHLRSDVPHLQNNTNNRIEAKWGATKQCVKPSFEIDDVISTLITLQQWAEEEYLGEIHRVGSRPPMDEDPELSALAVQLSNHAFKMVEKEFKLHISVGAGSDSF
ncbi:hypothetical protein BBJ28_00021672 [Nothophytophthora sp. Chile5]|nr:hypothetical protein BBJ28_00021672 [Nothophytophthora sp. Chile5]